MNYSDPKIESLLQDLDLEGMTEKEKAIKLFYYVRDAAKYSIKNMSLEPETFKASYTASQKASYCIPKAVLLCSMARAVGIPARIHLVDFINHRLSEKLAELWGTNVMASHTFTEMFIDGKWVKATPALDKLTCKQHGFRNIEFDGINDATMPTTDLEGHPHAEVIVDHGTFEDLPIPKIMKIFEENYGHFSSDLLANMFSSKVETFD